MPLGIKPTVDFAFKKIFGSPENVHALIGLLNAILKLPRPITQVTIRNPFNYQEFAEAKQIVLDIRAQDGAGRWLNIEMQVSVFGGLVERLVYYACSLYVDQLESGQVTPPWGRRFRSACCRGRFSGIRRKPITGSDWRTWQAAAR